MKSVTFGETCRLNPVADKCGTVLASRSAKGMQIATYLITDVASYSWIDIVLVTFGMFII